MRKAIYPGSFDPITFGHLDIISRSRMMFDEIIVAVLDNSAKNSLFSADERVSMIKGLVKDYDNVSVASFDGLTVDFAKKVDASVIIRGLRAVTDFEYELQIAQTNKKLSDGSLDTIFLTTSLEYAYLSSSSVKEIAYFGGDISPCVPAEVAEQVYRKYQERGAGSADAAKNAAGV